MSIKIEPKIESSWKNALMQQFESPYFFDLKAFLLRAYQEKVIYPPKSQLFAAYDATPFYQVKVIILGQDPYHGPSQAQGLSFSVPDGVRLPPSLKNILKEIKNDLGYEIPTSGNLEAWARQGVFLLNTYLSVEAGAPLSHSKVGWERFTDASIESLSKEREGLIFMLWGNNARKKKHLIDQRTHHVLESVHPSPLSAHRGFFGCGHFSKANELLLRMGKSPIDWQLK